MLDDAIDLLPSAKLVKLVGRYLDVKQLLPDAPVKKNLLAWPILENRPYLRALGNLARALAEQRKWPEALAIHQRMLELNPNDNQGVRYLIGVEHLQVGDHQGAIEALKKCIGEEVGCAFGLALARLRALGSSADVGEPLLRDFAANRDVALMLLGERWERLDAFHGTNMVSPNGRPTS